MAAVASSPPTNHLFVDLENVKVIESSLLDRPNLRVHLFLGPHQKKLDVEVVAKLLEISQAVHLVRCPRPGKNALDFVLAYHLGQAALADPKGHFHILTEDTGFDCLVEYLTSQRTKVRRHDDWEALRSYWEKVVISAASPALSPTPVSVAGDSMTATPANKASKPQTTKQWADETWTKIQASPKNRPKKQKTLRTHLISHLGKAAPKVDETAEGIIGLWVKAGRIQIDSSGNLTYRNSA